MPTKRMYKGDDLTKTAQDRKMGGASYEPWEKRSSKKNGAKKRGSKKKRASRR